MLQLIIQAEINWCQREALNNRKEWKGFKEVRMWVNTEDYLFKSWITSMSFRVYNKCKSEMCVGNCMRARGFSV